MTSLVAIPTLEDPLSSQGNAENMGVHHGSSEIRTGSVGICSTMRLHRTYVRLRHHKA
jgi:hypothetical protein